MASELFQPLTAELMFDFSIALPGYLIVLFCCYSLAVIGYNLSVFPECPEAADALLADIQRARIGLEAKGYRVD
jgi:Dolichol-phosphate mannosyltransferase subunit 3 (DPM3)